MKAILVVAFIVSFISVTVNASTMVGGFTEQDASKKEYHEQAWKAVKGINDQASNNGPYYYVPIKVCVFQPASGFLENIHVVWKVDLEFLNDSPLGNFL
ncbi:hypothetical protein B9Z55_019775 [Caenorhabditis nigoni]|uniref:Cystatin domain-containing protein n=1 Tax=Caenorhabditis nigoni TaxID=1611254 RepID=A0A2G5TJW4_9PELO|nr:hypothetical protein B9Z55_019775 [Caenorhabditis nigoni]